MPVLRLLYPRYFALELCPNGMGMGFYPLVPAIWEVLKYLTAIQHIILDAVVTVNG